MEPRQGLAGPEQREKEDGVLIPGRRERPEASQRGEGTSTLQKWIAKGPDQENPRANSRK